jgi:hypothetical protein
MKTFLLVGIFAGLASAATITYPDFSNVSTLTLNGAAAQSGSLLRLVPNMNSLGGSAYVTNSVAFNSLTSFRAAFEFLVTTDPNNPTDGLAFVLQGQGATALGNPSQDEGYGGGPGVGVTPSVAVFFRGRSPAFIGLFTNGIAAPFPPPGGITIAENAIYNRNEFAWVDYTPGTLNVYLATTNVKPLTPILSNTIDIFGTVGANQYIGFSAGTGAASGNNDILNFTFTTNVVTPEPGTSFLLAVGLAAAGFLARKTNFRA